MRALAVLVLLLVAAGSTQASFLAVPVEAPAPPRAVTQVGDVTVYPAYPLLTADLREIAAAHRDIVRLHSAGQTARGLDLWLVEVADFENPAKRPMDEREVVWVDGGTHANEYSGVMFVLHLLRWLTDGYGENETATWIVENRHTWILPLVNPEGSLNGVGRLNDNLVNINRNYPVGWGDLEETPVLNNPGPYGGSEAETRIVIEWWDRTRPDYVASIHCCGNLWLYPYGIEGRDPHADDAPVFARVCDEAYAPVREDCGPIWSTIYPASGSSVDTAYEMFGSAAFGFEMSGREAGLFPFGPPAYTSPPPARESESWDGVLHAFLHVERYGARPNLTVEAVDGAAVRLRVTNDGWGNLTRGQIRVADASGMVRAVALPRLDPGASAVVAVPGSFAVGEFAVTATWAKRALGGEGIARATLSVAEGAEGLVGSLGSAATGVAPADVPAPTPAPGLLLLLAGAALAVALRRR